MSRLFGIVWRGRIGEVFLGGLLVKPELLQVMTMTDVGILDDDFRFSGVCVCSLCG